MCWGRRIAKVKGLGVVFGAGLVVRGGHEIRQGLVSGDGDVKVELGQRDDGRQAGKGDRAARARARACGLAVG